MGTVLKASLVVALLAVSCSAAAQTMQGTVFADVNGNGRLDAGEPGIEAVVVSNGRDVAATDSNGHYQLPVSAGQVVFAVKPAGFRATLRANGLPSFWHAYQPAAGPTLKYGGLKVDERTRFDVGFIPDLSAAARGPNRMLVFADPQPKSLTDVGYYRDDVVADVQQTMRKTAKTYEVGTSLGDIVNDDLNLYPAMNRVTTVLNVPWLHVPGNHDVDMDTPDDAHALDTYKNTFGPDTFAWHEREFTFIGLDDVVWQTKPTVGYIGGFRKDQLAFLEAFLKTLPKQRLLVLGMHIPLFEPAGKDTFRDEDRRALFSLLSGFPNVLLLTAHNHTQQHVFHGADEGWNGSKPLHEYNVGAVCGAFWSGVKDARGIPVSTMADGTPNGWATLEVEATGNYRLEWHVARDKSQPAMHLSGPQVLRKGAYPAWGLYANAYMIRADSKVEFKVDDGAWKSMQRVQVPDPNLLAENARDDAAPNLRGYDRSPEAKPVEHLWRGALPTDLAEGKHTATVRFTDINGEVKTATRAYRLETAKP